MSRPGGDVPAPAAVDRGNLHDLVRVSATRHPHRNAVVAPDDSLKIGATTRAVRPVLLRVLQRGVAFAAATMASHGP